tara:strand:- start:804 stop:944 length:141 start_codon:yes stop_codon:yes gene_type:complete
MDDLELKDVEASIIRLDILLEKILSDLGLTLQEALKLEGENKVLIH